MYENENKLINMKYEIIIIIILKIKITYEKENSNFRVLIFSLTFLDRIVHFANLVGYTKCFDDLPISV